MNNAKHIHNQISRLTNVTGISSVSGKDNFFTPPWIFQVVLKHKDNAEHITTEDFFPNYIASVENITEEYGPLGKQIRGGISIWKSDKALLLVESPNVHQFPVKLWLSDPCHVPQFKINSQSVNCQQCRQVIREVPEILNNRMKKEDSILTLYECKRYKRYYCGCEAGTSLTGNPLTKYHENGDYHRYCPKAHSGKKCDLKFVHACDLWKHIKDHNSEYQGRGLVRLCVPADIRNGEAYGNIDRNLQKNMEKLLISDPNVLIVDPRYYKNDFPTIYCEHGTCIDFIVKEDFDPETYFVENKDMFVPNTREYYLKYFPLGAYVCETMINDCADRKCVLYENFHTIYEIPGSSQAIEPGSIKTHMIRSFLRKIRKAKRNGLWNFEELNGKYILNGGSVPHISMSCNESEERNSDEVSDGSSVSSTEHDSDGTD